MKKLKKQQKLTKQQILDEVARVITAGKEPGPTALRDLARAWVSADWGTPEAPTAQAVADLLAIAEATKREPI